MNLKSTHPSAHIFIAFDSFKNNNNEYRSVSIHEQKYGNFFAFAVWSLLVI